MDKEPEGLKMDKGVPHFPPHIQGVLTPSTTVPGAMVLGVPPPRPSCNGQSDRPSRRSLLKPGTMNRAIRMSDTGHISDTGSDRPSRISRVVHKAMDAFSFKGACCLLDQFRAF